jgi:hypothetical protein
LYTGRPGGFGIAAGEENGQVGDPSQKVRGGGRATHPRHDDIEDGERRGLRFAKAKGLLTVGGSQNTVAEADESLTNHLADGIVVFGDEDGLAAVKIESGRSFRGGAARRESDAHSREINTEEAALLGFTVDVNEAAVLLDDAINGGEAHAAALARSLVVKNGSKMRSRVSGSMPMPVSETERMA